MSSIFLCKLLDGSLFGSTSRFLGRLRVGCQGFGLGSCTSGHSARRFFGRRLGSYSLWDGLLGACVLKCEVKLIVYKSDKGTGYFFGSVGARLRGEFDFA